MVLFADDATENGTLIAQEYETYQDLFAGTEQIDLRIQNVRWKTFQDGFKVEAEFVGNYTFEGSIDSIIKGDMTLYLVNDKNNFKIKSLGYEFTE